MSDLAQLRRLAASVAEAPAGDVEVLDVGPFRAWLNPFTELVWLNYAVPVAPLDDDRAIAVALDELRRVFADRRRVLRFEYTAELWPTLATTLEASGLQLQAQQPLMLCGPAELRPFAAPDVQVRLLVPEDDPTEIATFLAIQGQGFGDGPVEPSEEMISRFQGRLHESGRRAVLGQLAGLPAGTGMITANGGIGELVGVATLPTMRHRGVATTVSAFLVRDHFDRGNDLAWLSAADAYAQAVYERIGFRLLGTLLNYIEDGAEVRTEADGNSCTRNQQDSGVEFLPARRLRDLAAGTGLRGPLPRGRRGGLRLSRR